MKNFLVISIILFGLASCSTKLAKRSIDLKIQYTSDYCGGAAPPEELINNLRKPKPFTGKMFIHQDLQRNDDGIEVTFVEGVAKISGLVEGDYYLYKEAKVNMDSFYRNVVVDMPMVDPNCLYAWQNTTLAKFSVDKKTKSVSDTLNFECNPCEPPQP